MWRDEAYLLDILVAARKVLGFTKGVTWEEFQRSDLLQNAVMRPLEIIGEVARKISQETKDSHPEIPWNDMIGMRNRLITNTSGSICRPSGIHYRTTFPA